MCKSAAAAGVLVAVTTLGACGGKPDGCVSVDRDVAQAIVDGAKGDVQLYASTGKALQSAAGVYYVAYKIDAAGSDEVGVWALGEIDPPGSIRSVDGFAQQFTTWPTLDGANGSDSARDVKACLD